MSKRTQPVAAPAGLKWVITGSIMGINGRPALQVGLWPEGATPDRDGFAHEPGPDESIDAWSAVRKPIFPVASEWVTRAGQIRGASKRALRRHRRHQSYNNLVDQFFQGGAA